MFEVNWIYQRCRAVILLDRPMERILVRYKKIPLAVDRIVRLERGGTSNREMILHNSIAKYLCCRFVFAEFCWNDENSLKLC